MFITKEELYTAVQEYQLADLTGEDPDERAVRAAIGTAVSEASSYLNGGYDCKAIFSAQGSERHPLLVEHCKSIALWYLVKRSNTDLLFERVKEYYTAAIDWLKHVAGVDPQGRPLAPDLPLKQEGGDIKTKMRYGSHPKFNHGLDD